jgi:peroxiredoxin
MTMTPSPQPPTLAARYRSLRDRRWFRFASEVGLVLLVLTVAGAWQTRGHLSSVAAPDFSLPTLAGDEVRLHELRGEPVLLAFWAPWCGVCTAQSGNVGWVMRLAGSRAHVLSVAAAYQSTAEVAAAARDHGMDYPVVLADPELTRRYRIEAFPTLYFLDADGRVKRSAVGYTTTLGMLWRLLF